MPQRQLSFLQWGSTENINQLKVFIHLCQHCESPGWVKRHASSGWNLVQNGVSCHLSGLLYFVRCLPVRPYSINCYHFVRYAYTSLPSLQPLYSIDFKQNINIISVSNIYFQLETMGVAMRLLTSPFCWQWFYNGALWAMVKPQMMDFISIKPPLICIISII